MTVQSILIVGCGNMGGAMLAGWLAGGLDPARFTVVDPALAAAPGGVRLLRELPDPLAEDHFDAVLLGVKPQLLGGLAPRLSALAGAESVVLSILAGVDLADLRGLFPNAGGLVRIMPNLAAALGQSPLVLAADGLDPAMQAEVIALVQPLGLAEWFADDRQFDLLTALVGSGPAFVYRLIEALGTGAAALGLEAAQAERLALAMVKSAVALAASSDQSPQELARRVTSPGGTTAAGLAVLDHDAALAGLITQTLRAARDRGAELAELARGAS